ncbi:MAG: endolytic transglycosylase MltG [Actinomycetota bacterium]
MQDQLTPGRAARHDHRDRPRRTSLFILFVLLAGLIGGLVWVATYYQGCKGAAAGPGVERTVNFVVEEGASAERVVQDLHDEGVIPCGGFVGNLLMRGTGKSSELRAGTYQLTTGMSLEAAVDIITTPPKAVNTVRLTIPPGYRLTQIADRVEEELGIPAKTFMARATSGDFSLPPYLPEGTETVEGFLYPETYRIPATSTADEVIQRLLDQFALEAEGLPWGNAEDLGVTPYEIVTIASMIEKEAAIQKDRPLIAGVIYNRLADGMQLGIDATILYADPTPDGELSTSDLETDTPYNTRIRTGLPPTPIASPYRWSLDAALNPAETDFYYYVLCGNDGGHRFAKTYAEHLHNVDVCL